MDEGSDGVLTPNAWSVPWATSRILSKSVLAVTAAVAAGASRLRLLDSDAYRTGRAHTRTPEVLRVLLDNHARFLAFLERRVGSREEAEDIPQEAFVRSLDGRL